MYKKQTERVFSVEKAHETQLLMSSNIICNDKLPRRIRLIAGVDVAYTNDKSIGAVTVHEYHSLKLIEEQTSSCKTRFLYIPTLLSFRETEPAVQCIRKLHVQPDLFLVDGHGFAHPFHCGFASHLGLILKKPTIGVAKSGLIGRVMTPTTRKEAFLIDGDQNIIGAEVPTKNGCRPVYVSIGHMVSLERAVRIVKHCLKNSRLPEPILAAHRIATNIKRKSNILSTAKTFDSETFAKPTTQGNSREDS